MIIHRVWSENVLKYALLDLNHLPEHGVIGVSGLNEAGKSTIGETICFALFGRTFSYEARDIVHVIRWGEPRCAVSVDFSIHGQHYVVSRYLDENGHHGVRLSNQADEPLARGIEAVQEALTALLGFGFDEFIESFYLAQREITTPHPHSTAVKKIAGIAALEHVAVQAHQEIQHEQHAMQRAEHAMAGVQQQIATLNLDPTLLPSLTRQRDTLHTLQQRGAQHSADLQARIERFRSADAHLRQAVDAFCEAGIDTTYQGWRSHVDALQARLAELPQIHKHDPLLANLTSALKGFTDDARQRLADFEALHHSAGVYRKHLTRLLGEGTVAPSTAQPDTVPYAETHRRLRERLYRLRQRRTTTRVGVGGALALTAIAWSTWGLLTQAPASRLAQNLAGWLAYHLHGWEQTYQTWLLPAAGLGTLLLVLGIWRSRRLSAQITQVQEDLEQVAQQVTHARQQATALETFTSLPLPQAVRLLAGFQHEDVATALRRVQQSASAEWIDPASLEAYRTHLRQLYQHCQANIAEQCRALTAQLQAAQADTAARQAQITQLDREITQEQARHQHLGDLEAMLASHCGDKATRAHRIAVRELANALLGGGAQYIAKTFNRDIRSLVSRTLPLLTQGRYEHLKIDENLDVQVFSNDKRDFMQLEEISSGTQRQIMLAVRLALSLQFIKTTLGRPQCIFLDEPFAFFDEARALSALRAFSELSAELRQIWIVAQSFPKDFTFAMQIPCRQDTHILTLSGA